MMFMTNLMNTHIERYTPFLALIKKCRNPPSIWVTQLRNVSEKVQETSPTKKNETFNLKRERRKFELHCRRKHSDFKGVYSYVNDDAVAAVIAEKVVESMKGENEASIVEINPGMGKITKCLLEMGIQKILLCDVNPCILTRELFQENENVTIYPHDYSLSHNMKNFDYLIPSNLLQNTEKHLKIIMINCCRMLIRNMLQSIAFIDDNFLAESEFYFLMNAEIFMTLQDSSNRMSELIDYGFIHVLFDMEVLGEFPREVVTPQTSEKYKIIYFVRLKRKKKPLVPPNDLKMYWNFLTVLSKKQRLHVLPCLEKWIPECGPLLIADGLLINMKLNDLTKLDVLTIFERLVSQNDFKCQLEMLNNEDLSFSDIS